MGHPGSLLHPENVPRKISCDMCRINNRKMGTVHGKQYRRLHQRCLQAHELRRKRKSVRKRLARAHQSNGYDRMRSFAARRGNRKRLRPVQRISNTKVMNKSKFIEIAVKIIVAALTAFLTAITTTSCLGKGPF